MRQFGKNILDRFFSKKEIGGEISINDLRDRDFSGQKLSAEERKALENFDHYRLQVLNDQKDEESFHAAYRQLQVIANLGDYREFLKPEYSKS